MVSESTTRWQDFLAGLAVAGSIVWASAQSDPNGAAPPSTPPNLPPPAKSSTLIRPGLTAPPAPVADTGRPVLPDQFVLLDREQHLQAAFGRLAACRWGRCTQDRNCSLSIGWMARRWCGPPHSVPVSAASFALLLLIPQRHTWFENRGRKPGAEEERT
jgi:hypothetical protein